MSPGVWTRIGGPGGAGLSANDGSGARGACTILPDDRPYLFMIGDGVQLCWWTGTDWQWNAYGQPPGDGIWITHPIGAVSLDGRRPHCFVATSDLGIWSLSWSDQSA